MRPKVSGDQKGTIMKNLFVLSQPCLTYVTITQTTNKQTTYKLHSPKGKYIMP